MRREKQPLRRTSCNNLKVHSEVFLINTLNVFHYNMWIQSMNTFPTSWNICKANLSILKPALFISISTFLLIYMHFVAFKAHYCHQLFIWIIAWSGEMQLYRHSIQLLMKKTCMSKWYLLQLINKVNSLVF